MGIQTAAAMSNQLNSRRRSNNNPLGHIINWRSLPWLIALGKDNETFMFWLKQENWVRLAEENGLNVDDHVSQQNPQTEEIWISVQLKTLADDRNWVML